MKPHLSFAYVRTGEFNLNLVVMNGVFWEPGTASDSLLKVVLGWRTILSASARAQDRHRRRQSQSRPIGLNMLTSLTAPDFTLLLLGITVCLGGVLVWAFWKLEQRLEPLRSWQMAIFRPDGD